MPRGAMRAERARRRGLAADDIYSLRYVSDAQISPDGTRVAYVVQWADPADHTAYRSQVRLVSADGDVGVRPLTAGARRDWAPRWSPDGQRLAFLSNRDGEIPQLFLLSLVGGEARPLTRLPKYGAGPAVWSPDGTRLAFVAATDDPPVAAQEGPAPEPGKSPRMRLVTRLRHKADGVGLTEARFNHLFVLEVDLPDAEPRQVTRGAWDAADPCWSPDGRQIAFVSNQDRADRASPHRDVWLTSANGGRPRRLVRNGGPAAAPAYTPDGAALAYQGHQRGDTYGASTELLLVAAEGGEVRSLSRREDGLEVGNVALSDGRDPGGVQPTRWLPDGSAALALVSEAGRVGIWRFPRQGPPAEVVGGDREVAGFTLSADGQRLAFTASDPARPYEVYVASADGSGQRRLSDENGALLETAALAGVERVGTRSAEGHEVEGWLMRPLNTRAGRPDRQDARAGSKSPAGKRPLVLAVHGGPEAMYGWTFMHEFQVLAARGYGVLYTNPRGSKGYGEAHNRAIAANWGGPDAADLLAALDNTLSHADWVDAERVYLSGGSYGGYMTAWLVGHTHRFRAAVAQRGAYNLLSFYGTSDISPWFLEYVLGGPAYEREALYRERSPLTYAAQVRTPLLLIHNEGDLRCPMEQAEQLYLYLKRIGRAETELVRFPDENHNLSRSGRPDRRVQRLERLVGWFDRHP